MPRLSPRQNGKPSQRPKAAGDSRRSATDWEEELEAVKSKEYETGEEGALEAREDMNSVLHEVAQDPIAKKLDKLIPRFLTTPPSTGEEPIRLPKQAHASRSKALPRHSKLTARPLTTGDKSGTLCTEERASVPNITRELTPYDPVRPIRSAPNMTRKETPPTDYSEPFLTPVSATASNQIRSLSKPLGVSTTEDESTSRVSSAKRTVDVSLSSTAPGSPITARARETEVLTTRMEWTFSPENLLEVSNDSEDTDEGWKSDIVEITRLKSASKGKSSSSHPESLELKYKDPVWPHQLFLHQILTRQPFLKCLVLDGSELRFLRDLGTSLQSLITLSVCDCGLRSLDGVFGIPNLRTLIARKNKIQIPSQLSFLRKLSYLDLSSNPITSADVFGCLIHCGELRVLKVYDTPLANTHPDYNKEIKRLVPQLKEIHPTLLFDLSGIPQLGQVVEDTNSLPDEDYQNSKLGHNLRQTQKGQGKVDGKERSKKNPSQMPSLSYDEIMSAHPKPGIAYQKIKTKTLKEQKEEHFKKEERFRQAETRKGDFSGYFMAPKFLQHLEEAMITPSADEEDETGESYLDIDHQEEEGEKSLQTEEEVNEKSDSELVYGGQRQKNRQSNYGPMGDGDYIN